jgi:hypothetical protein
MIPWGARCHLNDLLWKPLGLQRRATLAYCCWCLGRICWPSNFCSCSQVANLGGHFGPDLIGRIRTATSSGTEAAFFPRSSCFVRCGDCLVVAAYAAPRDDGPLAVQSGKTQRKILGRLSLQKTAALTRLPRDLGL